MPSEAYEAILRALGPGTGAGPARGRPAGRLRGHRRGSTRCPPDVTVDDAAGAPVACVVGAQPGRAADGAVVWFHGGGYVIGVASRVRPLRRRPRPPGRPARAPARLSPGARASPSRRRWTTPSPCTAGWSPAGWRPAASCSAATRPAAASPSPPSSPCSDAGDALPAAAVLLSPWADLALTSSDLAEPGGTRSPCRHPQRAGDGGRLPRRPGPVDAAGVARPRRPPRPAAVADPGRRPRGPARRLPRRRPARPRRRRRRHACRSGPSCTTCGPCSRPTRQKAATPCKVMADVLGETPGLTAARPGHATGAAGATGSGPMWPEPR